MAVFVFLQMRILRIISFLIERMQSDIQPHTPALIQYLPGLWASSAEHNLLRCAILTTLTVLVEVSSLLLYYS